MPISWLPYGAVIIITAMTIWHVAKTWKHYAPAVAPAICACHALCIGMLCLLAGSLPLSAKTFLWLTGFVVASIVSALVAAYDGEVRRILPGTHAYRLRDGFMALLFVVVTMIPEALSS